MEAHDDPQPAQQQPDPHRQDVEIEEEQPEQPRTYLLGPLLSEAGSLAGLLLEQLGVGHYADARKIVAALDHVLAAAAELDGSRVTA